MPTVRKRKEAVRVFVRTASVVTTLLANRLPVGLFFVCSDAVQV